MLQKIRFYHLIIQAFLLLALFIQFCNFNLAGFIVTFFLTLTIRTIFKTAIKELQKNELETISFFVDTKKGKK